MATTSHFRLRGIISEPMLLTDADLRAATAADRQIFEQVKRQRFVEVTSAGFGKQDRTYTVTHSVPSITSVPPAPVRAATVPPKARKAQKASKGRRRALGSSRGGRAPLLYKAQGAREA